MLARAVFDAGVERLHWRKLERTRLPLIRKPTCKLLQAGQGLLLMWEADANTSNRNTSSDQRFFALFANRLMTRQLSSA